MERIAERPSAMPWNALNPKQSAGLLKSLNRVHTGLARILRRLERSGIPFNEDPLYLQATGFVLRPNGTVAVGVYSSSAIGRLVAADTINYLKYLQKTQSPT